MIIGEGPGVTEVSRGKPFVGPSGRLLEALLGAAGLEREELWITNATLGLPPRTKAKPKGSFHDRFPNAIYSCLPRLELEIKAARPRVIITLGDGAFVAVAGSEAKITKQIRFDCDGGCNDKRKIGPAICCALGDCGWYALAPNEDKDALTAWAAATKERFNNECPTCSSSIKRLRPRMMKCPKCNGRKTRVESRMALGRNYVLTGRPGCCGARCSAQKRLKSRLDEFGVKYIIPTYHPAFLSSPGALRTKTNRGVNTPHVRRSRTWPRQKSLLKTRRRMEVFAADHKRSGKK